MKTKDCAAYEKDLRIANDKVAAIEQTNRQLNELVKLKEKEVRKVEDDLLRFRGKQAYYLLKLLFRSISNRSLHSVNLEKLVTCVCRIFSLKIII